VARCVWNVTANYCASCEEFGDGYEHLCDSPLPKHMVAQNVSSEKINASPTEDRFLPRDSGISQTSLRSIP